MLTFDLLLPETLFRFPRSTCKYSSLSSLYGHHPPNEFGAITPNLPWYGK